MINKTDIIALIQNKKGFPLEFSAREAWMLIHKKMPDVSIEEFTQQLQNISKDKSDEQNYDALLEYYADQKGVRLYSLINSNNDVVESNDIIMKIKQAMCNLDQQIQQSQISNTNEDYNLQNLEEVKLDETNFSVVNTKFMNEYEISAKCKIKADRIRPFISILVELGIIIIEYIEIPKHFPTHCHDDDKIHILSQVSTNDLKHDDNQHKFNFVNNTKNQDHAQHINRFFPLGDLTCFQMININDDSSIDDGNDLKIDTGTLKRNTFRKAGINKNEIENYEDRQVNRDQILLSQINNKLKNYNSLRKRMLKWDESREMNRKNLSSSFEYLNNLRSMKESLINLISKSKNQYQ